ncbi:MAG: SagB/ThcOx family dehydrogenase [Candidatus Moraniibacteriota bacterium]
MDGIISRKFHDETNFDFTIGEEVTDFQYNISWDWKKINYKEYPRFPKVELPRIHIPYEDIENALIESCPKKKFDTRKELSLKELSNLLFFSSGLKPTKKTEQESASRFYPSFDARYPLEVYIGIQRVQGISPGIYHYNVKGHFLETLTNNSDYLDDLKEGIYYPDFKGAAVVLMITAVWNRTMVKYKDRGYRIILMETGYLAQNLALVCSALGVGCHNTTDFHNQRIHEVLDIENEDEDSISMVLIGK